MFNKQQALNREHHTALRFDPNIGYSFAANLMTIPAVSGEAKTLARDYVLIFDKTAPALLVLLGVETARNAYVNDKGQWLGRYRPAYIRAYPFGVIPTPDTSQTADGTRQYTIIIDPDAPQLQAREGEAFFDADGKPTDLVEKVQKVMMSLERDRLRTAQLVAQLEEAELLVERHIQVKGSDTAITGFRVIDAEALSKLSGDALMRLRDTGALMLAYAQIFSLDNLKDSPLSWAFKKNLDKTPDRNLRSLIEDDSDLDLSFLN